MQLIGIDPGLRTGVCKSSDYGFSLDHRGVYDQKDLINWLRSIEGPATVVYEMFRVYPGKAHELIMKELYAPETIGMIKSVCWDKGWTMVEQWASTAKAAVPDPILKNRGYTFTAKEVVGTKDSSEARHAKDAGRHLLYYVDFAQVSK